MMKEGRADLMDLPGLRRINAKYHDANISLRRKAVEAERKANEQMFRTKGKGQWELYRQLKKESATPFVAVRRVKKRGEGSAEGNCGNLTKRSR